MTRAELVEHLDGLKVMSNITPTQHSLINLARLMLIEDSEQTAELERYRNLICPPPCETCGDKGTYRPTGMGDWPCPECHGRPKQTLHDRLMPWLSHTHDGAAILADVAKAVTP